VKPSSTVEFLFGEKATRLARDEKMTARPLAIIGRYVLPPSHRRVELSSGVMRLITPRFLSKSDSQDDIGTQER
jgi:hypothetical protein